MRQAGWFYRLAVFCAVVLLLGRGHERLALAGPLDLPPSPLSSPGGGVALSAMPLRMPSDGVGGLSLGPRVDAPLIEDVGAPHGEMVLPDQARVVAFEGAVLEIPQGAVDTIRPLPLGEVQPMGRAMVNVTPGGKAYRFGPHGLRFKKPVRLTLPYDEHAIPPGMTAHHVVGFYFDEALGTWQRVERAGEAAKEAAMNSGTIKWVVTEGGELLVSPHTVSGVEISHAVLSGGRGVLAAGQAEIAAAGGRFVGMEIVPHSGHFMPSLESVQIGIQAFAKYGIGF
ncbi:hypothetical protein WME99_35140 [Sorangium sp. So ce136]|uniref:hypothetical protein n=1 Tax=Sorangium sp. So ce136 TaxID=3133284 RepID=UPI003EFC606D